MQSPETTPKQPKLAAAALGAALATRLSAVPWMETLLGLWAVLMAVTVLGSVSFVVVGVALRAWRWMLTGW